LSIREEVRTWTLENWESWEEEMPDWFTEGWRTRVSDDMIPDESLRRMRGMGGGRRRSTIREAFGLEGGGGRGREEVRAGSRVQPVQS
jgi:hypothetical protein